MLAILCDVASHEGNVMKMQRVVNGVPSCAGEFTFAVSV